MSWPVVCNLKWAFFLLHQSWFLLAPVSLLLLESEKGNPPPGQDIAVAAFHSLRHQASGFPQNTSHK